MCGRTDPLQSAADAEINKLKNRLSSKYKLLGRIAPTDQIAIVKDKEPNVIQDAYWSLIPSYAKEFKVNPKFATFNAKSENLLKLPTWQKLVGYKHCAIFTNGFYEWNYDDPVKKKGPHIYAIKAANDPFTIMAGLYEEWVDKTTGEILISCTMITNPANEMMAKIHNTKARMPAFLTLNNYQLWLNNEIPLMDRLDFIKWVPHDFLTAQELNPKTTHP